MITTATHPNKPRTTCCRRRHLVSWTGWSDWEIEDYVRRGLLEIREETPGHRRSYFVASAQAILDRKL